MTIRKTNEWMKPREWSHRAKMLSTAQNKKKKAKQKRKHRRPSTCPLSHHTCPVTGTSLAGYHHWKSWFLRNAWTLILLPNLYLLEPTLVIELSYLKHVACLCKKLQLQSQIISKFLQGQYNWRQTQARVRKWTRMTSLLCRPLGH